MRRDRSQPLSIPATAATDASFRTTNIKASNQSGSDTKTLGFDTWLLRKMLSSAGNPAIAISLWDGRQILSAGGATPKIRLTIKDRGALMKLCLNPDLQLGELYTEGRLLIDGDLEVFLDTISRSLPQYNQRGWWSRLLAQFYLLKRNTLSRAKDNIYHHYDLGNEFYRLWLDREMVYTCAYFPTEDASLEQAQHAKMDHIARKLRLRPGQQVIEAGCGWGALALHLAKHFGVTVKAYNISKQQLAYARERARAEGMDDRVEYIESDYREIDSKCDAFVSVGMLEHVGVAHYRDLGAVINRCLRDHGRGLIHSIGRNRPAPMNAWIERRIFPGAYPPTLSEMAAIFEPFQFSILDVENIRLHYAQTLRHWLQRFDSNADKVRAMFDEPFVRAWRLYLAGSIMAFKHGELQLFQVVFNRHDNNDLPLTREFLYSAK
jgi:cyclopropane-fatty-acyl-phospholipid synthase